MQHRHSWKRSKQRLLRWQWRQVAMVVTIASSAAPTASQPRAGERQCQCQCQCGARRGRVRWRQRRTLCRSSLTHTPGTRRHTYRARAGLLRQRAGGEVGDGHAPQHVAPHSATIALHTPNHTGAAEPCDAPAALRPELRTVQYPHVTSTPTRLACTEFCRHRTQSVSPFAPKLGNPSICSG